MTPGKTPEGRHDAEHQGEHAAQLEPRLRLHHERKSGCEKDHGSGKRVFPPKVMPTSLGASKTAKSPADNTGLKLEDHARPFAKYCTSTRGK